MLFQTTQAHEDLRAIIRAFAETEVKPNAILMDQESRFPAEAIQKLAEMGLMGIPYPKEYGGAGLDVMSYGHLRPHQRRAVRRRRLRLLRGPGRRYHRVHGKRVSIAETHAEQWKGVPGIPPGTPFNL